MRLAKLNDERVY